VDPTAVTHWEAKIDRIRFPQALHVIDEDDAEIELKIVGEENGGDVLSAMGPEEPEECGEDCVAVNKLELRTESTSKLDGEGVALDCLGVESEAR